MKKKKIIIIVLAILVLVSGTVFGSMYYVSSKIHANSQNDGLGLTGSSGTGAVPGYTDNGTGIVNIALAGLDARGKDSDSRTDSIMMATLDKNNKELKLTSFMRDMYVTIPGYKKYKINTAYALGGPTLLMQTLNEDFNANVQYYATIDFKAFQAVVDKLGGVDLEVKKNEVKEINYYIKEVNWGNPDYIKGPGYQHLNGQQALSYCRIRHVGNNDYERTERQRRVLSLIAAKMKDESLLQLPGLFNSILPYIRTNIPTTELLGMMFDACKFSKNPVNTLRIPVDNSFTSGNVGGQDVLLVDMDGNKTLLNQFVSSAYLGKDAIEAITKTSKSRMTIAESTNTGTKKKKKHSKVREGIYSDPNFTNDGGDYSTP